MAITIEMIQKDLKTAMKAHDQARLLVLRMLISSIRNKQIEIKNREEASEDLLNQVLKSEIKKRRDAAESYRAGMRAELADREEAEIKILEAYLPAQMSEDEIRKIVGEVIAKAGEGANFGAIMGQAMAMAKGRADGATVKEIVKEMFE